MGRARGRLVCRNPEDRGDSGQSKGCPIITAMNPIVYAIPVFLATIVLEAWIARRRGIATYDIPDALTSLHHGVLSQVAAAFSRVLTLGLYVAVWEQFRAFELSAANPLVWVFALLAYDLAYYWYHRMSHEVALFWGGVMGAVVNIAQSGE